MESLEVRKVENGYIVVIHSDDGTHEYIFDTIRRVMKFLREKLDGSSSGN